VRRCTRARVKAVERLYGLSRTRCAVSRTRRVQDSACPGLGVSRSRTRCAVSRTRRVQDTACPGLGVSRTRRVPVQDTVRRREWESVECRSLIDVEHLVDHTTSSTDSTASTKTTHRSLHRSQPTVNQPVTSRYCHIRQVYSFSSVNIVL